METQNFGLMLLGVAIFATLPLLTAIPLIWIERKIAARIQDRLGPNRVGPAGIIQPIADALKMITKEDITPVGTDKVVYNIAPLLAVASVVLIWANIPLAPNLIGVDLEIGILYIIAVASLGTLAIVMAGWSSNNKYALLGAFRVVAQLVSYEVPLVLSILIPVLFASSLGMQDLVAAQHGMWFFVMSPLAAILFFISAQAETGRAPFDLIEAESELVAGFNIEYSGMKFGLFFVGEFVHVFTNGILMALLFFGGWWGPGVSIDGGFFSTILAIFYLLAKTFLFYFLSLLLRNSVPRIRIDQLMAFNWKFLVPVSIVNVLVVSFVLMIANVTGLTPDGGFTATTTFVEALPATIVLLFASLAQMVGIMGLVSRQGREARLQAEAAAVGD
ncbi:MAG: NADH-quinone oxidoreductase subunit NuoH [Chloroflexota bacterium]